MTHQSSFYVSSTFHTAWAIFKKQWWQVLAVLVGTYLITMILSSVVNPMLKGNDSAKLVFSLVMGLINIVLSMGAVKFYLAVARQEKAEFSLLWKSYALLPKYILGNILYVLIVIGGLILLVFPGLYWGIKYMYIPYLIIDKGIGPKAAMKLSSKMTSGIKLDLIAFAATSLVLVYLGILALGVGLLIAVPVVTIAQMLIYDMALNRAEAKKLA